MKLIENLSWRYATKRFDTTKKVNATDLATIKKAVQLSASSYGLQLYKVLVIEDEAIRQQLQPVSWNQPQIVEASHLFVFCNYATVSPAHIEEYLALKSTTQSVPIEQLKPYGQFIQQSLANVSATEVSNWTAKQTYIALGNLLAACAELKIDACPMEGFNAAEYGKILGLEEKGLQAAVIATIGYRSVEDLTQHGAKVRKPLNRLFEVI